MDGFSLICWCVAIFAALLGTIWLYRRLHACLRASHTTPTHCPVCAYDLAGLESSTCPECGLDTLGSHRAARIRSALCSCAPCIAILLIAGTVALAPIVAQRGPLSFLPTSALIAMLPWAPGEAHTLHDELISRVRAGDLTPTQGTMLASRCALVIADHTLPARRAGAARVLGASPDHAEPTARAVAIALRHTDEAVRLAVLPSSAALAREHPIVREALVGAIAADPSELSRARAVDALRRCGELSRTEAAVLTVAATSASPRLRQRAIYAIAAAPPDWQRSCSTLALAAADTDESVREAALIVLGNRARTDAAAIPILTDGLADPSPELRIWTASQLRLLGTSALKALPALLAATTDHDGDVRAAAGDAINTILRSAVGTLL